MLANKASMVSSYLGVASSVLHMKRWCVSKVLVNMANMVPNPLNDASSILGTSTRFTLLGSAQNIILDLKSS